jgi:cation transporter-like permease
MVRAQFTFGIALALLGITGILFSAMSSQTARAPFLLFAPIVVTAFGVLGIIMGIAGKGSFGRRA